MILIHLVDIINIPIQTPSVSTFHTTVSEIRGPKVVSPLTRDQKDSPASVRDSPAKQTEMVSPGEEEKIYSALQFRSAIPLVVESKLLRIQLLETS
jgi:hypothetical protein